MVSGRQPYEKVSRVTQIVMPALELAGCGARWLLRTKGGGVT
jgi:hypothetical protein